MSVPNPNPHNVKAGQVWQDTDPRVPNRTITILSVLDGSAYVVSNTGRKSRILLERFEPGSTGYQLVEPGKHK